MSHHRDLTPSSGRCNIPQLPAPWTLLEVCWTPRWRLPLLLDFVTWWEMEVQVLSESRGYIMCPTATQMNSWIHSVALQGWVVTLSPAICLSLNSGIIPSPVRHCSLEGKKQQLKGWKTQEQKQRHKLWFKRCSSLQAESSLSPPNIWFGGFVQVCAQRLKSERWYQDLCPYPTFQHCCRTDGLFKSLRTPVLSALGKVKTIRHKTRLPTSHPLRWTQIGQKETWIPEDVAD